MTPEQAWNSNPITTAKLLQLIRESQNPDQAKKKEGWTRAELLNVRRGFYA